MVASVALKVKMAAMPSADALVSAVNQVDDRLQKRFPQIQYSFFEPDNG